MRKLFLTSTVGWPRVAKSIFQKIGRKQIRMPFIMTPAEVVEADMSWLDEERKQLRLAGFTIYDYTISHKSLAQIKRDLHAVDALYISGGNEYYFKYRCNKTGFGDYIVNWINSGKPYIGTSAGSILLAPDMSPTKSITDIEVPGVKITDFTGLGIVDFLVMPHWGSQEFRDLYLGERKEIMYNTNNRLILLNNYQYIEVLGDQYRIIDVRNEK